MNNTRSREHKIIPTIGRPNVSINMNDTRGKKSKTASLARVGFVVVVSAEVKHSDRTQVYIL